MKTVLMVLGALLLASPAFAGIDETDPSIGDAMRKLSRGHSESVGVREIKAKIEREYAVNCSGRSSTVFPDITKQVTYRAVCEGTAPVELKVISSFSSSGSTFEYNVKSYSVSF